MQTLGENETIAEQEDSQQKIKLDSIWMKKILWTPHNKQDIFE